LLTDPGQIKVLALGAMAAIDMAGDAGLPGDMA
jgi:hypothetical protein